MKNYNQAIKKAIDNRGILIRRSIQMSGKVEIAIRDNLPNPLTYQVKALVHNQVLAANIREHQKHRTR